MAPEPLRFHNGEFRIMAVGDLHEPFDLSDPLERRKTADTLRLLEAALAKIRPDLVVFMGDQGKDDSEEKTRAIIARILAPLKAANVPYALVFGNHDPECAIPLARQLELYREEYGNFYIYNGAPGVTGCGNCSVTVKNSAGEKDILNLWFADSGNRGPEGSGSYYDWLREDQLRWYRETAAALAGKNGGAPLPAVWFMHIPVPEERALVRRALPFELPFAVKGFGSREGRFYIKRAGVPGYVGEDPACAEVNSGIFAAWKETGDVFAAVFGHDHMNDFAGVVDGITLCQCKTASFHVYTDGCNGGVRLLTFKEENVRGFSTRMVRFKELGLKSLSLGPVQRRLHDRQVIWGKIFAALGGAAAVCAGTAALLRKKR